jgi:hypothetical protein
MERHKVIERKPRQDGFVLWAIIAIATVLLATGMAFMRWAVDEDLQAQQSIAAMQAYYLAQMGIIEQGFEWLRTLPAGQLPIDDVRLPGKQVSDRGQFFGEYQEVHVMAVHGGQGDPGNFFAQNRQWRISAIGVVKVPMYIDRRSSFKEVKRKAVLYVETRNFVDYMYLTGKERTRFGDYIKFWHGDTLMGRVHSNDTIAIMQDPVFYGLVSTTAPDFWHGTGYNPHFYGPRPVFRAKMVLIPDNAENLRSGAALQGNFVASSNPPKTVRAYFTGSAVHMYRWPTGSEFDPRDNWIIDIAQGGAEVTGTCIFVDGPLEVLGDTLHDGAFTGKVTIGSSQNLRILDNIRYVSSAFPLGTTPLTSNDVLGLVSEGDVKIANTPANGRANSGFPCGQSGSAQNDSRRTDITITAAIVALGESFTFENQNDPDSGYVYNCGNGGGPDDRGTIYLFGSVTQARRGYVHRSTQTSTGYLKQYQYDTRLVLKRPPCFFDVTDNHGYALFNIIQWGQGQEDPADFRNDNMVRYN